MLFNQKVVKKWTVRMMNCILCFCFY